jgi:hypothetical protein
VSYTTPMLACHAETSQSLGTPISSFGCGTLRRRQTRTQLHAIGALDQQGCPSRATTAVTTLLRCRSQPRRSSLGTGAGHLASVPWSTSTWQRISRTAIPAVSAPRCCCRRWAVAAVLPHDAGSVPCLVLLTNVRAVANHCSQVAPRIGWVRVAPRRLPRSTQSSWIPTTGPAPCSCLGSQRQF